MIEIVNGNFDRAMNMPAVRFAEYCYTDWDTTYQGGARSLLLEGDW